MPDGTEADKEPSFAAKVATLLRSGKDHERRTKSRPAPEREIIYNLRSRLARIKEVVARLEAERRCLVQATRKQQAEYQAAMSDLLLQVAVLERDLKERQAEYQAEVLDLLLQVVTLECNLITSQRDCAALLAALEAERGARLRGTILVGAGLGTAGLTWAAIPSRYAWMGYTTAVGLVLRGLLELILPAGLQPTQ